MKAKAKTKKQTKKAQQVIVVERIVGLADNYETPSSVQNAIDSYRYCSASFPVHRIIEYVRRLENVLKGKPQCGHLVLRAPAIAGCCLGGCR